MMSGARLLFGRLMSEYGIRVSGRSAPVTSLPRQASGDLTRNFEGFLAVKHHQGGRVSGLEADGQAREETRKLSEMKNLPWSVTIVFRVSALRTAELGLWAAPLDLWAAQAMITDLRCSGRIFWL
jgi:hypothetical protein